MFRNSVFKVLFFLFLIILLVNMNSQSDVRYQVKVNTNDYMELSQVVTSDKYFLKDNYVYDILPKTKKKDFLSSFQASGGTLSLSCENDTDYVGSGCQIQLSSESMDTLNYELVVQGDVNGDGNGSLTDIVQMMMYSKKEKVFDKKSYVFAGDLDANQSIITDDISTFAHYLILKKELPKPSSLNVKPSIQIDTKRVMLDKNEKFQIEVKSKQDNVSIMEWKSLDEKIAKVDNLGLIAGIGNGTTTVEVVASDGDVIEVIVVVVVKPTGITFSQSNLNLIKGESTNVIATVSPSDVVDKTVTYQSNDVNVVTVDKSGVVKAVGVGSTTIKATTSNGISTEIPVTVTVPATSISLNATKLEMDKGKTTTLVATVGPSDATNKKVTWSSSNPSIATINTNGLVTAVGNGTVTITATLANNTSVKASCTIDVSTVYTSLTKIGTISATGTPQISVKRTTQPRVAQGFAVVNNYYVAALRNGDDTNALVKVYNKNTGELVNEFYSTLLDHANGMAFDGNYVYIVTNGSASVSDSLYGTQAPIYYKFPVSQILSSSPTMTKGAFYNSNTSNYINISGAAYDKSNGYYYLAKGSYVRVYDKNNQKVIRSIKKLQADTPQDIGAYNGKILVIRFNGSGDSTGSDVYNAKNAIDIYRASDGAYLGTYTINSSYELESVDYFGTGKYFALYFYVSGQGGAIYKVQLNI